MAPFIITEQYQVISCLLHFSPVFNFRCIDKVEKLRACCEEHRNKPKHCAEMSGLIKEAGLKQGK
jgi:hypothetical protein